MTHLFGIEITPIVQIAIIVVIALVFTFTSFIGLNKGMQRISNGSAGLCILFLLFVLIAGPTTFIMKNTVSSFGWMIYLFPRMSLFTDPITQSGFAESWTMFFQAFYLNYGAMMGIFIARISKGRTMRQLVWATLIGVSAGGWFLFCIDGGFAIFSQINGVADIVGLVNSGVGQAGVGQLVSTLPLGSVVLPSTVASSCRICCILLGWCFILTGSDYNIKGGSQREVNRWQSILVLHACLNTIVLS